jgi:hypothetical protein
MPRLFLRKPSLSRALGISKLKGSVTRATGGRAVRNPKSLLDNASRRIKSQAGYYSTPMKIGRALNSSNSKRATHTKELNNLKSAQEPTSTRGLIKATLIFLLLFLLCMFSLPFIYGQPFIW